MSNIGWFLGNIGLFILDYISRYQYPLIGLLTISSLILLMLIYLRHSHRKENDRFLVCFSICLALLAALAAYTFYPTKPRLAIFLATIGYLQIFVQAFLLALERRKQARGGETWEFLELLCLLRQSFC